MMRPRVPYGLWPLRYALAVCLLSTLRVDAQESEQGHAPAPASVHEMVVPMDQELVPPPPQESRFPRLDRQIENLHPFLKDGSLVAKPRTYYFDRDREDGTRSRAWAIGGSLDLRSGWWKDVFSVGAELYDSEKVKGEDDEPGSGLLEPVQEGYTILGRAYVKLKRGKQQAVFYRQALDLPYVNRNDSRMTPNTFEAYTLRGTLDPGQHLEGVNYAVGYVDKIRPRFAGEFVDMATAAGATGIERGLLTGGAQLWVTDKLAVGGVNHYVHDVLNIAYGASDYTCALTDEVGLRLESQFSHQSSLRSDFLTGEEFKTWNVGARASVSFHNFILKTAFSTTDDEGRIRSPYGSYPGYVSLMQKDFNRPGEDAWLVGASYDFKDLGLDGFSMFANYAEGYDAREVEGLTDEDQREFDITADMELPETWLKGAWLRFRWSTLDLEGEADRSTDFRVILNYELPIF